MASQTFYDMGAVAGNPPATVAEVPFRTIDFKGSSFVKHTINGIDINGGHKELNLQFFGRNAANKLKPDSSAYGYAHSTFKVDSVTGKIINYETYAPKLKNPTGVNFIKRYDGVINPHTNKVTGQQLMPHVHDKDAIGGIRTPNSNDIP